MADFGALIQSIFGGPRTETGTVSQPLDQPSKISKGQLIAGILADALAGAAGQQGRFAPMMERRRLAEDERVKWSRNRQADIEDYVTKLGIKQKLDPDISPMERDARAWAQMTQPEKDAYLQMNAARAGDPEVFVTLPNGQVYAGPKSGLASALMGRAPAPTKPIGSLTPLDGGPTPPASGGFRFP